MFCVRDNDLGRAWALGTGVWPWLRHLFLDDLRQVTLPWPVVVVPSINEDAKLHGLKILFTSGISGFCEVSVCNFVAHLKTTPYPFRSTRGRYDLCFGPTPD